MKKSELSGIFVILFTTTNCAEQWSKMTWMNCNKHGTFRYIYTDHVNEFGALFANAVIEG